MDIKIELIGSLSSSAIQIDQLTILIAMYYIFYKELEEGSLKTPSKIEC